MARIWAGTDIGKTHHHCVVVNAEGERLLSRRVLNDEPELLALLADVLDEDVVWAVDVAGGMAALWISVLLNHGQHLVHIPGLAVNRASAGYRGMGKPTPRTPPSSPIRPGCVATSRSCKRTTNKPSSCGSLPAARPT